MGLESGVMAAMQVMILVRSASVTVTATDTEVVLAPRGRIEGQGNSVIVHGGSDKLDVEVPVGSDLVIATASGAVRCCGSLGMVSVTSASGKVILERADQAEVRTASGSIDIGEVLETIGVLTKGGSVTIASARRVNATTVNGTITVSSTQHAEVNTVSGRVKIATTGVPEVKIRAVSANIEVSVERGSRPAMGLVTVAGKVRCDCATGTEGDLTIKTVSGAITVIESD